MANYIVTGHTGEAHITSDDVRTFNAYTLGTADYLLPSNDELALTVIDNHTVKLDSGDILMQGIHARIPYGTSETIYLEPGTAGYKRIDLIIARYENDGDIEQVTFEVLQGESTTGDPVAPTPTAGDLLHGDTLHEMALYSITFDGVLITGNEILYNIYKPGGATTIEATLTAEGWADNAQTLNVIGVPANGFAYVITPASASYAAYTGAGIYADDVTSDNYITFHCSSAPTEDITVNVLKVQVN